MVHSVFPTEHWLSPSHLPELNTRAGRKASEYEVARSFETCICSVERLLACNFQSKGSSQRGGHRRSVDV